MKDEIFDFFVATRQTCGLSCRTNNHRFMAPQDRSVTSESVCFFISRHVIFARLTKIEIERSR